MESYPLKFEPILKHIIWGGSEICRFKKLAVKESGIGESWEISQVPGSVSIVANGSLAGKSLTELIEAWPDELMGKKVHARFGDEFPLLIKFIDAQDNLSIQVHPDDKLARSRHNSFGKTEMWYVIGSKPGSKLISGFSKPIDAAEYERRIADSTIEEVLQHHEVKAGDVFFIPAGRVHAIGAGIFVAEIQQSSNITYRLYDYNRKDAQGKGRELHTELAKDAIDYQLYDQLKTTYRSLENEAEPLVSCPYFTTSRIQLKAACSQIETVVVNGIEQQVPMTETMEMDRDYSSLDSFVIYVCMQGEGSIEYGDGLSLPISQGESVLLPATLKQTTLRTDSSILLLETYIG
ncbi:MAG: class I mannose-6-phosphate isomerase [Bacteroidota bacterium]|nr:class I mannose-6-phosphate isomerase [Bacteroidota bacterium]